MTTYPGSESEKGPILHEEGEDLPLGRPFLQEDHEKVAQTFEFQLPVVEDALGEFLSMSAKESEGGKEKLRVVDYDAVLEEIKKELMKNKPILALAIIEAGLYCVNKETEFLESKKEKGQKIIDGEPLADRIDFLRTLAIRYGRTEDFLFTHSDFSEILPSKDHLLKYVADEKQDIENMAKKEENEALRKLYDSRLKSVVPAYDRFLKGQQVVGDYNTLLSALEERLQIVRELINDDLLEYMATKNEAKIDEVKRNTKLVYTLRSFLALMEGERNEKIDLRR